MPAPSFASTFRVKLEIDSIDIHKWTGYPNGDYVKTIAGGGITAVMFNSHLEQLLKGGFLRRSLLGDMSGGSMLDTPDRTGSGSFDQAIFGGHLTAMQTHRDRPTIVAAGSTSIWKFDTAGTYISGYWDLAREIAVGPLRGSITTHDRPSAAQAWAWYWDASENPTFPSEGLEYRSFGRVIYESL